MKTIQDMGKKIITVTEIQEYFKIDSYPKLVELVQLLMDEGSLCPVKSSRSNGMSPPLYNKYRVKAKENDLKFLADEINYAFPVSFHRDYYLNNLEKYQSDREYILKLAAYLRSAQKNSQGQGKLDLPMAINERSFDIWGQEKFLKEGGGQSILKNLGLSPEDLNIYATPEPFVYFSCTKDRNQRVLIIENKDTWYTMRRLMIEGQRSFLGQAVDTIIYGSGKNIEKSLAEYEHTVEEYLLNPSRVWYWGDIDYEGIGIYERLKQRYTGTFKIELFKESYLAMVERAEGRKLPDCKEKQNKNIHGIFFEEMIPYGERIVQLLDQGFYIPQEIVNYQVLKKEEE